MKVTLQELETHWSFDDLLRANDFLDALDAAESAAQQDRRGT